MQSGNYLAIHCTVTDSEPISVELIHGVSGPVTLDADGIIVLRIADKDTQIVKVVSGNVTKYFTLSDLVCQQNI